MSVETATAFYEALLGATDLSHPAPEVWRRAAMSGERESLQRRLIEAADTISGLSEGERLGLMKAAHLVLPLREAALLRFVERLVAEKPVSELWSDALVECLFLPEIATSTQLRFVLEALGEIYGSLSSRKPEEKRQRDWIARHALNAGWRPTWIDETPSLHEA